MADTLKEELEERIRHQPKIQVAVGNRYGVFAGNGKYENVDPETGLKLLLTPAEWDAKWAAFAEKEEARRREKIEAEQKRLREEGQKLIAALPREQMWVKGADKAKRVLGRNNILGMVLRNHDVVTPSGILLPAHVRDTDPDFEEVMIKSTFIRVLDVSDWIDKKAYPWLWEAKQAIMRGGLGPVIEINPGSGTARRGSDGICCLFINAQWCWLEYPEPGEEWSRCRPGIFARAWRALSGGTRRKPTKRTAGTTSSASQMAASSTSSASKSPLIQPGRS